MMANKQMIRERNYPYTNYNPSKNDKSVADNPPPCLSATSKAGFCTETVFGDSKSPKSNSDRSCSSRGGVGLGREAKPGGGGSENNPGLPRDSGLGKLIPPPSSDGPITEIVVFGGRSFS